jgi:hypothetical protein
MTASVRTGSYSSLRKGSEEAKLAAVMSCSGLFFPTFFVAEVVRAVRRERRRVVERHQQRARVLGAVRPSPLQRLCAERSIMFLRRNPFQGGRGLKEAELAAAWNVSAQEPLPCPGRAPTEWAAR